jgi:hypothetical protein
MTAQRKMYIVRLCDRQSDPMVGIICGSGQAGTMCYDTEYETRKFNPNQQVLVDKKTSEIIGLDLDIFK